MSLFGLFEETKEKEKEVVEEKPVDAFYVGVKIRGILDSELYLMKRETETSGWVEVLDRNDALRSLKKSNKLYLELIDSMTKIKVIPNSESVLVFLLKRPNVRREKDKVAEINIGAFMEIKKILEMLIANFNTSNKRRVIKAIAGIIRDIKDYVVKNGQIVKPEKS